ncbi:Monocarboxylate transporter 13,Monocarboxylate transporter 14,Monocarboxylate transporter 3 [Mytilus coruscus]|uniref:Monocarboxylate transporter 13,Monocarboxylate transporter 14,Monocarboxylate transporter 3 n=1 Tax=Mytilus coruscus TaxID=42192 RepID=A0A6J8BYU5_MYTCO|nr:Monocarboxylate transporter 13,Monocarboxylate transporter 14,Monocarboxylate transporter 3 [Mytilus coruscus]
MTYYVRCIKVPSCLCFLLCSYIDNTYSQQHLRSLNSDILYCGYIFKGTCTCLSRFLLTVSNGRFALTYGQFEHNIMEEKEKKYHEDLEDEDLIPTPPDGGWGWMVTFASLVCNFIVDGIGYAFGVLLPIFAEHFEESKGKVSLVGSLLFGVYLCSGPIASGLVNKFGCRPVTIAGSIIASVGFLLGSFAPNLNILILTYGVLGGLGFGLIYLPSIVTVGFYFEKRRALATGIAMCGSGIGTFVFSPLNDYLLGLYGWRNLLFIQSGIILNGVVCGMLMRPLKVKPRKRSKNDTLNNHAKKMSEESRQRTESDPDVYERKILTDLISKDPSMRDITNGRGSLPEVHYVSTKSNEINSNMKETYQPLIIKEIIPRTNRSRADSQPSVMQNRLDFARPMYKKDIFYRGSIDRIPQFRSQPNVHSYVTSITSIPGIDEPEKPSVWDKCTCLPKTVTDILKEMLDFSLMLKISFFMLFIGNVFACTGYFIPFSYIVDRAVQMGISSSNAAFLLSIMGITNTIGRVLCGFLADLSFVNPLILNNAMLVLSAAILFLEPLCTTYAMLVGFSVIYGLCIAAYISLTSPIICDLLGIGKLSNAFGLLILARGVSGIYGPPLAGAVFQATNNYDASFYLGGGMYLLSAVCHMVLHFPCIKKEEQRKDLDIR